MIKIFNATDTDFKTAGNIIINPLHCHEIKKKSLNGWYIEVEIPIKYKEYIEADKLCVVKTKSKLKPQAFRINDSITYTNRKIKFTAEHVMFDSRRYVLLDVRPTNLNGQNGLKYVNERTDKISPFSITSNVENVSTAYFIRKTLLESWQVFEERWGGVFEADNWNISFKQSIGKDNGETIVYGKNMQGFEIFEDWSNVCTKILPVGYDGLLLPEKYLESETQYEISYTKIVDFQTDLEAEEQTETNLLVELRNNASKYLEENCVPKVSYTVNSNVNNDLEIGDTIKVLHPFVNIFTEVLEYEYDLISEKVKSLTFGNYTRDVKTKFNNIKNTIETIKQTVSKQEITIKKQTNLINSLNKNGYVYIDDNEILILDQLPKEKAKNVWRFGLGGIGFSSKGYEGPFEIAITMDGKINADFITTGTMAVDRIEGLANFITDTSASIAAIELQQDSITTKVSSLEKTTVNKVQVQYALGDTLTTPPTAGWSETAPEWQAGKYMWQKTVTTYSDGATKESKATCIQGAKGETGASGSDGADGKDGENGKGILNTVVTYQTGTSGTKAPTGTWSTTIPNVSAGQFLWTKTVITYTDNTTSTFYSISRQGENYWKSNATVDLTDTTLYDENKYYPVTGSNLGTTEYRNIKIYTTLDSSGKPSWSTHNSGFSANLELATLGSGWGTTNAECIIYSDNYKFCAVSPISFMQLTYSSTPVVYLRGGGKYYIKTDYACSWTIRPEGYTWTSGNYSQTAPVKDSRPTLEGTNIKGKDGKGIKSIQDQYYLSTSNTAQTGGAWKNTQDAWESGKYIWTRSHITWSDDTTTDTTPILAESLNTANENAVLAQEKTAEQKIEIDSIKQTVSQTQTTVANNYTEIKQKFGDYAPKSDVITLQNSVERIQTDTYTKTEINTKLTDGSVTKVTTTCGTFDENGLTIEKTNAKTKGNFNEKGMKVVDATGSSEEILLFAGYDEKTDETIVKSKNMTVEKYLTIGANCRFEDYVNPVLNGKGTGAFTL